MVVEIIKTLVLGFINAFIWGFATYNFIIKNQDKSSKDPVKAATIVAIVAGLFGLIAGIIGFILMCVEKTSCGWLKRKDDAVYTKEDSRKLVKNIIIWLLVIILAFYGVCFGYGFCKGMANYNRETQGYLSEDKIDQDVTKDFVEGKYAEDSVQEAYELVDDLMAESFAEEYSDYRVKVNNGNEILVQVNIPYNKLTDDQALIDELVSSMQEIDNVLIEYLECYENNTNVILEIGDYEMGYALLRIEQGQLTLNNLQ